MPWAWLALTFTRVLCKYLTENAGTLYFLLSRSTASSIALLIKAFTLSPLLSAWALIASFLPLGTVRLMRSSFSAIQLLRYSDLFIMTSGVLGGVSYTSTPFPSLHIYYHKFKYCAIYIINKYYAIHLEVLSIDILRNIWYSFIR